MVLNVTGAALYGYVPGNTATSRSDADYIISGKDIDAFSISERANELKDSAKISVDNYDGVHTGKLDHGDRIEFWAEGELSAESQDRYGETKYGKGTYSGGLVRQWTGMVRNYTVSNDGGPAFSIDADAEDFVYAVLGARRHYASYRGDSLAGSSSAILNTALRQDAPEIDRSELKSVGVNTDIPWNGKPLLDLLNECLERGDAVAYADGTTLHFHEPGGVVPEFTASSESGDWFGGASVKSNDDELINQLRVNGGSSPDLDDELAKAGTMTATESTRATAQVQTRKSEIDYIEIWTDRTGSEEDVIVRLQKDEAGAPIAINDSKSDIVRKELSHEFISKGDWTTFLLPEHTLPEPNPWVIVQTSGTTGQTIGTDGGGTQTAAYKAWFPFPVNVQTTAPGSASDYRRRDGKLTDESLRTSTAAYDAGNAHLRHRAEPRKTVEFEARSARAHGLQLGELIDISDPRLGVDERFVVVERGTDYQGSTLRTTITAHALDAL